MAFGSSAQAHLTRKLGSPTVYGGAYVMEGLWWNFKPRQGTSRLGADMLFDENGKPVAVQTRNGLILNDQSAKWQAAKFQWRTTMAQINTMIHIWQAHMQWGNTITIAIRSGLWANHPLRR